MYGVVLWSDPKRRKAVIWCEDQRDLAYFNGACEDTAIEVSDTGTGELVPYVGDMLVFDVCENGTRREAVNLRRVATAAAETLIEKLKEEAKARKRSKAASATVVDFRAFTPVRRRPGRAGLPDLVSQTGCNL